MALETELKLALRPRDIPALLAHPLLAAAPTRALLHSIYYDTPALTLARQQLAVRLRQQGRRWVQTIKTAEPAQGGLAQRHEWETPATPGTLDFSSLPASPWRETLQSLHSQLQPIFTTRFQRRIWLLHIGQSLIEVALDRGTLSSGEHRQTICELELELRSGMLGDLFALAQQLQQTVRLHPDPQGKAERGYRLYLGQAPAPIHASHPKLDKTMSAIAAFRTIALACLDHLQHNEAGIGSNTAPEYVHQARVAVRRLRSAITLFRPVLPKEFLLSHQPAWRALGKQLGEARDWDVFTTETLPAILADLSGPAIDRLQRQAERRAKAARKHLAATLQSAAYSQHVLQFTADIFALQEEKEPKLAALAKQCLKQRSRKVKRAATIFATSTPNERHALRLAVKKLRYAQEFFANLSAGKDLARKHPQLATWQSTLGRMNDLAVAETLAVQILGQLPVGLFEWFEGKVGELMFGLEE